MKRLTVILNLIICFQLLNAQIDKEFWFAIPKETGSHGSLSATNNVSFKITNQSDVLSAHVEISMPANASFQTRTIDIAPGQTYTAVLATSFAEFQSIYANPSAWNVTAVSGTTNHGVFIKSNNDISVYYDYDNYWNRDLFTLKGKNALGTDFYTPFQNIWSNGTYTPDVPLSSANIVATEDGTTVWIYPTKILQGRSDMNPFSVTLNRGQTYTIVAKSAAAADHFTGTRIVSTDPNKPIAVTINDDSVNPSSGGCRDIVGDQIVPTSVIGTNYLIMTGTNSMTGNPAAVQQPLRTEQIFVTGTQNGTTVEFIQKDGTVLYTTTINGQETTYVTPDITNANQTAIYVRATYPVYVFHITGISCEVGGALVPPISNCTGSNEVSFFRSSITSSGTSMMALNLMIPYDNSIPFNSPSQSHNFFTIHYQNGNTAPIPSSWFEAVPIAGRAVLSPTYRGNSGIGTLIPINQAVKITNDKDYYHLGLTNGSTGQTNKYGYFSTFNTAKAEATVASVNETQYTGCFGDTVFLKASGGIEYNWHYGSPDGPATYLNDCLSSTPRAICPPGIHDFYVVVHSNCYDNDTLKVSVQILPQIKACITPKDTTINSNSMVSFRNNSAGNIVNYLWEFGDGISSTLVNSSHVFINNKSVDTTFRVRMIAASNYSCQDTAVALVKVRPYIKANFTAEITNGCSPLQLRFINTSTNRKAITQVSWNFDGIMQANKDTVMHVFVNKTSNTINYKVLLTVKNQYTTDTVSRIISVYPEVIANFTTSKESGKSPLTVTFTNESKASSYEWDFGDDTYSNLSNPNHTFINTSQAPIDYTVFLTAKNNYNCEDTCVKFIKVHPDCKAIADFSPSMYSGYNPMTVTFVNNSSNFDVCHWDFGDSTNSNVKSPSHVFYTKNNEITEYEVKLIVSKPYCSSDSATHRIMVHPGTIANVENQDLSTNKVKVFPNPAQDKFKVQYTLDKISEVTIELISPSGASVKKFDTIKETQGEYLKTIDFGTYNGDLLFVKITIDGNISILKVIHQ